MRLGRMVLVPQYACVSGLVAASRGYFPDARDDGAEWSADDA